MLSFFFSLLFFLLGWVEGLRQGWGGVELCELIAAVVVATAKEEEEEEEKEGEEEEERTAFISSSIQICLLKTQQWLAY